MVNHGLVIFPTFFRKILKVVQNVLKHILSKSKLGCGGVRNGCVRVRWPKLPLNESWSFFQHFSKNFESCSEWSETHFEQVKTWVRRGA